MIYQATVVGMHESKFEVNVDLRYEDEYLVTRERMSIRWPYSEPPRLGQVVRFEFECRVLGR